MTLSISFTGKTFDIIYQSRWSTFQHFVYFSGTSDGWTGTSVVSAMKRRKVSNFKGKMGIMFREREMEIFHHSEMTPRGNYCDQNDPNGCTNKWNNYEDKGPRCRTTAVIE